MGKLFVVGTPIGNLEDFSPRAIRTLEECDFIAAEDTRVTLKLLNHFNIKKQMISYFEHNIREKGQLIVERILDGENCAIVTDAGMPAISDPGEDLIRLCHEHGIKVESVPGPCAFSTALALSGMPSGRFTFEGFLSVNKPSRNEHLNSLVNETRTMIFYEAPHKIAQTLKDMNRVFGNREIAIVREITKIHEEVIRTTLDEAVARYGETGVKGEIVIIVHGKEKTEDNAQPTTLEDAVALAKESVEKGMSVSEAAKSVAKLTGFKKGDIYKALI
ncbi:MAG: 16S rRNA (cytidine(1402)-2'-O)-methyltransferase [Clostridia bacterium]|nr:16S rRNA (cytidine(1402)-2'-O)-methyltransferase [Clostridia bacterium]